MAGSVEFPVDGQIRSSSFGAMIILAGSVLDLHDEIFLKSQTKQFEIPRNIAE